MGDTEIKGDTNHKYIFYISLSAVHCKEGVTVHTYVLLRRVKVWAARQEEIKTFSTW